MMNQNSLLGQPVVRLDAYAKASGQLLYPSDVVLDQMVWVQVLRAAHPHARILSIDTSAATALPGVVCVLTAKDIPGDNHFGLLVPDQPVLCTDRVRYLGDAIAVVAAENDDLARQARDLIQVEYEILPVLSDPHLALEADAPQLHPKGNLCSELKLGHGDVAAGFAEADFVFESAYQTGRQEHAFLETEAGVAYYDEQGRLTVCAGGQNPFKDVQQICAALGLAEDALHVLNPMMGGAFGGKEDISVQIYLALVTYHTKRPCRLMLDRHESITTGVKRHPFHVRYKTGVKKDGRLTAAEVSILADTGAYMTLGPAVIALAAELCCGPYYFPHTKIEAKAVYTNNGNASAFRGFGNPQVLVGLEQHIEMMAEATGLDPIAFRLLNTLKLGQQAGIGHVFNSTNSLPQVLGAASRSDLYAQRQQSAPPARWKRRGVGLAAVWQSFGMGAGIPDDATARLELRPDGRYHLYVGCPEMGQGNATAFAMLAAQELNSSVSDVEVTTGDSLGPDSGSSNASRTLFTVGAATIKAAVNLREKIMAAARRLQDSEADPQLVGNTVQVNGHAIPLAELAAELGPLVSEGYFHPQQVEEAIRPGMPHAVYSYSVQMAQVEVDLLTGEIEVLQLENYLDAGRVIHPPSVEGQSEGGIAQGLGYALMEDIRMVEGHVLNPKLSTYIIPSIRDVPAHIKTVLLEEPEPLGTHGARGVAEITLSPTAGAILNAIHNAIGVRFDRVPVRPEMVLDALQVQG